LLHHDLAEDLARLNVFEAGIRVDRGLHVPVSEKPPEKLELARSMLENDRSGSVAELVDRYAQPYLLLDAVGDLTGKRHLALGAASPHVLPPQSGHYVEEVKNALKNIVTAIKDPKRAERADWQDEILVYYSGHGFPKYVDDDRQPYAQVGLLTPDSSRSFDTGVLWVDDDLAAELRTSNLVSLIIIDACSAQINRDEDDAASSERIQLKLHIFRGSPIEGQTELQFLLGTAIGRYSYEQRDFAVDDFVPGFMLWPAQMGTKGSGVFSLGLLASLLCQEATDRGSYTFDSSSHFLKDQFFTPANAKWDHDIRPKLEQMMKDLNLSFVTPDPDAFGYPGGGAYSPALRSGSATAPRCGFSKK
jgi:hypothetical protein